MQSAVLCFVYLCLSILMNNLVILSVLQVILFLSKCAGIQWIFEFKLLLISSFLLKLKQVDIIFWRHFKYLNKYYCKNEK